MLNIVDHVDLGQFTLSVNHTGMICARPGKIKIIKPDLRCMVPAAGNVYQPQLKSAEAASSIASRSSQKSKKWPR